MADAPLIPGLPPLHAAIAVGDATAAAVLLAGGDGSAANSFGRGVSALSLAACLGHDDIVSLLLAGGASPLLPDSTGSLPLHRAAAHGKAAAARLLLAAAPEAALVPDASGYLPCHRAANFTGPGGLETLRLLIQAAPASLCTHIATDYGGLPVHCALAAANTAAVKLLIEQAPATALVRSHPPLGDAGLLPLQAALGLAVAATGKHKWAGSGQPASAYLEAARPLLAVTPSDIALPTLAQRGQLALPLFVALAERWPLSSEQWEQVPRPCPGLGRALPAVLARSEAEAAQLVAHLPAEGSQRLRTFALSLHRQQQRLRVYLPPPLMHQILALFDSTA